MVDAADQEQLLKWLWRISSWNISANVTVNPVVGAPSTTTFSRTINDGDDSSFPGGYENEAQKVCPHPTQLVDFTPPNFQIELGFSAGGIANEDTGIYKLGISAQFLIFGEGFVMENFPGSISGEIDFTLDGQGIILYRPFNALVTSYDGAIEITADSFWPYARSDDTLPCYDNHSGAQLIPTDSAEFIVIA